MKKSVSQYPEIEHGAQICELLRKTFYPTLAWGDGIVNRVARLYSALKRLSEPVFPSKSQTEMIQTISHFSLPDFKELCEMVKLEPEGVLRETSK